MRVTGMPTSVHRPSRFAVLESLPILSPDSRVAPAALWLQFSTRGLPAGRRYGSQSRYRSGREDDNNLRPTPVTQRWILLGVKKICRTSPSVCAFRSALKLHRTERRCASRKCKTGCTLQNARFQASAVHTTLIADRESCPSVSNSCVAFESARDVLCTDLELLLRTTREHGDGREMLPFERLKLWCPFTSKQRRPDTLARSENACVQTGVLQQMYAGRDLEPGGTVDQGAGDGADGRALTSWKPGRIRLRSVFPEKGDAHDDSAEGESLDAVLVLAGGQVAGGGVPLWVERRLDLALQIQRINGPSCKIVLSGGGTPYRPPQLTPEGFVLHESSSCVNYLRRKGVDVSVMLKEWASYDTIGNGYLSLTHHVIPLGWRRMAVVTSAFHMPRSKAVFEWIFGLKGAGMGLRQSLGSNGQGPLALDRGSRGQGFLLQYHGASDEGIDKEIIGYRISKERRSLQNLEPLIREIHTLSDFHEWFHSEHKAYNVANQDMFGRETLDDPAVLSY